MLRRLVPTLLLPLAMLATALSSAAWLRSFPTGTIAVPLFGAAVLGVLVPTVVVRSVTRSLPVSALIDVVVGAAYLLLVVLHDATAFGALWDGLVHGPAQVLSFALPLVTPPSLMVVPVALCWLAGAFAGECLARSPSTLLPYGGWVLAFALTYAGTARATLGYATGVRADDVLLGGALLCTFGLVRVAQAWLRNDASGDAGAADGVLPGRGLLVGALATLLAVGVGALAVHASPVRGRPAALQRSPAVNQSAPLAPLAFVSGLRPGPGNPGSAVFDVTLDGAAEPYFAVANLDFYDGDSWSFNRTFRPSGGVVPNEIDPALHPAAPTVTQHYMITGGSLGSAPWMPYLYRPARVSGTTISVDQGTGMIVPDGPLRPGASYTVTSSIAGRTFDQLGAGALVATSAPPIDVQVPPDARTTLGKVITAFAAETGVSPDSPTAFLQALARDLRNYALSGAQRPSVPATPHAAPSTAAPRAGAPTATSAPPQARSGGTGFADVLASVVGPDRTGTPEQFATLYALVARSLGVPARVVTGFHLSTPGGASTIPAGRYPVTTASAWTWVEIPVRGAGWVVVDPSPSRYSAAQRQQRVGAAPSNAPTAIPSQQALVTQTNGGHAVAPKSQLPGSGSSALALWPIALVVLAVLALAVLAWLWLRKLLRCRRRARAPDPRTRLVGAWQESLDVLAESGLPGLDSLTGAEVAAATTQRYGAEPAARAARIGSAANVALFSSTLPIGAGEADAAWRAHRELRRQVRRGLPLRARARATLRYHVPPRRH